MKISKTDVQLCEYIKITFSCILLIGEMCGMWITPQQGSKYRATNKNLSCLFNINCTIGCPNSVWITAFHYKNILINKEERIEYQNEWKESRYQMSTAANTTKRETTRH